ncbi:Eco57I restriction-modification methylase domain-containing protein [Pimelobacter simplex]|uniref:Eco57I restriction-modification methylase domain-containing protein n=1 Tax=Nocardioides simplex TaxID=2045 RepID=UPI00366C80AE
MRKRTSKSSDLHSDWLAQVDVDGPFLAYPVLKDMWPNGVDRLGDTDDRLVTFKQAYAQWQRAFDRYVEQPKTPESKSTYDAVRRAWIDVVLDDIAEWDGLRTDTDVTVRSPGEQITVTATGALQGRDGNPAALLLICEPTSGLRDAGLDGWAANDIDRLAILLRKAEVEIGIVTDGQWWALVWAKEGKPTGSGMVNALTWAEEPLLRDAYFTLINQRRFRATDAEQRLTRLFERSELEAEEITEALGTQVRRSVELLVQAFSEARLEAAKAGDPDPLTEKPDDIYQAAVTVMMRIVFLLFAEERDMLPTEELYWNSYAIRDLLDDLRAQAAGGEEHLDETFDAWHRLLAVSQALHGGVNYDELRMPAYGGSLLDPERFPWLHATDARGLRLKVADRVMLHVLESVQTVVAKGERRRISFREIDVEQIGYIYEGLLGYSCAEVTDDIILGLVGKDGEEPEIALSTVNDLYDEHGGDAKKFATALTVWVKENQPAATGKTAAALAKLVEKEPTGEERAELVRLLTPVADGDTELLDTLVSWGNLIRRDLRNIPLVFPVGGLVVVETPSRKNAGAHYTPRSLAEEVVLHALQPLVYEPGPPQTNDEGEWRLKSAAAILDLKVADIAAGSGAFLVAAARYLSERLVEAWIAEGILDEAAAADAEDVRRRAMREVIARCLYGADINPMAVEMCKLSLWLVSMDKTKPFSFVDDKVFCGNSLLGLTSLDQLRYLHIYPKPSMMQQQILVDIDARISAASRLRHELASPIDERDAMRSTRAKTRLLGQFNEATAELRLIADGVVAAGLPLGGKSGRQLDDAFKTLSWQLHQAFPTDGSHGDRAHLLDRIAHGLTPSVHADFERWRPLHWAIEAPDVLIDRGGFDAVIGNPPFLVAKDINRAVGDEMRAYMANVLGSGVKGKADLAAYFLLRAAQVSTQAVGVILPKSIAEGSTRVVGLDQVARTWTISRAFKSVKWPTPSAQTRISKVWLTAGVRRVRAVLEGEPVGGITSELEPLAEVVGQPMRLTVEPRSFLGSALQGKGFLLPADEASELIEREPALAEVLRPYVNAQEALGAHAESPSQWAIDFREMSEAEARRFGAVWQIALERVRPERMTLDPIRQKALVERWWVHQRSRPEMYATIRRRSRAIAMPVVSRHAVPVYVPTESLLASTLCVFDSDSPALFAVLSSSVHRTWLARWGSTMQTDFRYASGDVWDTFVCTSLEGDLEGLGVGLFEARERARLDMGTGVSPVYNRVDDPSDHDAAVESLRAAIQSVDACLWFLYGWDADKLAHDWVEYKNVRRFWLTDRSRQYALDRLLELNHDRARAEGQHVPSPGFPSGQGTLFA